MSKIQCRATITGTVVMIALLSSRTAEAQFITPGPPGDPGNDYVTGVWYDRANQAKAEHRLPHAEARLRRDVDRGHVAAADRDSWRIRNLRYRIVVDEWLIRQNSLQDPGCYPYPLRQHPISCEALAQYGRVPLAP